MNEKIERHVNKLFRNPRFWLGLVLLLIFSSVFDITIAAFVAAHGILSGKWNQQLLTLGVVYVAVNVGLRYFTIPYKKDILKTNRLLIVVLFIWGLVLYGFFRACYFVAIIFLCSRLLRVLIWVTQPYFRSKKR